MSYATIIVEDDDQVRRITLNRPERRNAMTPEMQQELISALEQSVDARSRVVILTGAGDAFCSGLDLSALLGMRDKDPADHHADAERVSRLFRTLYELPLPTIAAVHGAAIAGGTGLATICDFTLASPEARFGFTEVRIGFVPALVSAFLALQIGDKRSRDLLLSGRIFDATEALRLGLVNEIVGSGDLEQRTKALAQSLIAGSPLALAATKRLLAEQNKAWLDRAIEVAQQANADARRTEDFREGIAAFLEKRKPAWSKGDARRG